MKLFLGEYSHTLDDRGRVTLPKKIRQVLDGVNVIVSRGFDTCIFGYDRTEWEREAEKQMVTPVTEANARSIRRYMFSAAEKVEIDKLGRMVVPAHLKEYSGITDNVIIIGAGDHFEIWDEEHWRVYKKTLGTDA